MSKLIVIQTRSTIGIPHPHRLIVKGLGLRGIGSRVLVQNSPSFRGMVKKILHLVSVAEAKNLKVSNGRYSLEIARS